MWVDTTFVSQRLPAAGFVGVYLNLSFNAFMGGIQCYGAGG